MTRPLSKYDELIDDQARALFSELCEGDGEHSEALDRNLIKKHLRIVLDAALAAEATPQHVKCTSKANCAGPNCDCKSLMPPGNWHAIEGPNGMCACGTENGACGDRLRKHIEKVAAEAAPRTNTNPEGNSWNAVEELDRLLQAVDAFKAGASTRDGLWHYAEIARRGLATISASVSQPAHEIERLKHLLDVRRRQIERIVLQRDQAYERAWEVEAELVRVVAAEAAPQEKEIEPWKGYWNNWIAPFHACPRCGKSLNWQRHEDALDRPLIRAECCGLFFGAQMEWEAQTGSRR